MAFKPSSKAPDLDRLQSVLLTTGLQTKNNSEYQVLKGLIDAAKRIQDILNEKITTGLSDINNLQFLTSDDESSSLPNSRELVAGTNVSFDDSLSGQRIVNASGGPADGYWTLLTDGDPIETDFIFVDGDPISVFVPL